MSGMAISHSHAPKLPWSRECLGRFELAFDYPMLLASFFLGDGCLLPLAIDVRNCKCPKRNQIKTRHKFGSERWQELPVPAQQTHQYGCDSQIKQIISRRQRAFSEQWQNKNL